MDFIAPDDKPSSLPPATLKALADAKERGELLQYVDCYWNPPEFVELQELSRRLRCPIYDMRFRHSNLSVADLPEKELRLLALEAELVDMSQAVRDAEKALDTVQDHLRIVCNMKYDERSKQPEHIKAKRDIEIARKKKCDQEDAIKNLKSVILATKEWKPQRRYILDYSYNDHKTTSVITKIEALKDTCPDLSPKLIAVVNMRKTIMAEMNESRGTPMRNVYLDFNLTSMDYNIAASWITHRKLFDTPWLRNVYEHHTTEYNLYGAETVAYQSKERLMIEIEKAKAEERGQLKKIPYENYFLICRMAMGKVLNKTKDGWFQYDVDSIVHDGDKSCELLVATNVNHTNNTFTIIGYMYKPRDGEKAKPYIKKVKVETTITYPVPNKRAKTTQLQKDLKKLTQNYEIPE